MSASLLSPAEFLDLVKTGKMPERLMQRAAVDASPDVSTALQATDRAAKDLPLTRVEEIWDLAESMLVADDRDMAAALTDKTIRAMAITSKTDPKRVPLVLLEALLGAFTCGMACAIEDVVTGKLKAETLEGLRGEKSATNTAVCIGEVPDWFTQAKVYKLSVPFKGHNYVAISRLSVSALVLACNSDGKITSPIPLAVGNAQTDAEILGADGYSIANA